MDETAYRYETADVIMYKMLSEFAKNNRRNPTEAENYLWNILRRKQLGLSFRRQHIIGQYIADFICIDKSLILEIDGGYHQMPNQQINDQERSEWLENQGYKIIRFTNEEVLFDTDNVIKRIKKYLE